MRWTWKWKPVLISLLAFQGWWLVIQWLVLETWIALLVTVAGWVAIVIVVRAEKQ